MWKYISTFIKRKDWFTVAVLLAGGDYSEKKILSYLSYMHGKFWAFKSGPAYLRRIFLSSAMAFRHYASCMPRHTIEGYVEIVKIG